MEGPRYSKGHDMSINDKFCVLKIDGKYFRGFQSRSLELDLVDHPAEAKRFYNKEEVGRYAGELIPERRQMLLDKGAVVTEITRTPKAEEPDGARENSTDPAGSPGHESHS